MLFTSGYTDDAMIHHGVDHTEVAFLRKLFTPPALVRKVRGLLDRQRRGFPWMWGDVTFTAVARCAVRSRLLR